jgi:hypothetical protein
MNEIKYELLQKVIFADRSSNQIEEIITPSLE